MGLLDDAIREHLELKRLRGADPGEVAREQREALDPVPRDERRRSEHDSDHVDGLETEAIDQEAQPVDAYAPDHPAGASELAQEGETSDDLRETAELDMRTLMLDQEEAPAAPVPSATSSMRDVQGAPADEDSLEWEFPRGSSTRGAAKRGDQEHGSGRRDSTGMAEEPTGAPAIGEGGVERSEEPLREPPEQERLRFEQPPSRRSDRES